VNVQNFIFPVLVVRLWYSRFPLAVPLLGAVGLWGCSGALPPCLHAGVLKKFGLYGLIRIALPLMPQAAHNWMQVIAWLAIGNILYVGWVAMRQKDLNLLIGNSSVAHMGFIFLGIASLNLIGVTGAVLIMVAHGFLAALTFALSGYIYQKAGTLEMSELGGLCRRLPFIGTLLLMAAMAGCGLPGFANFVGEATVFFGAWSQSSLHLVVILAVWGGLIIGAVYMTRAVRNILHGPLPQKFAELPDAYNLWRKFPYASLAGQPPDFGFVPKLLTEKINPDADKVVAAYRSAAGWAKYRALADLRQSEN
jgi:NADH-quinone oxidoreductase subunit M